MGATLRVHMGSTGTLENARILEGTYMERHTLMVVVLQEPGRGHQQLRGQLLLLFREVLKWSSSDSGPYLFGYRQPQSSMDLEKVLPRKILGTLRTLFSAFLTTSKGFPPILV